MAGRRGASPKVQRALGWTAERDRDSETPTVLCPDCGHALTFDVLDPEGLGRSMQRCTNRRCDANRPHPMTREMLP